MVLTHAHPHHVGGLVDPANQAPIYPNAEIVLTGAEFEFWTGDAAAPLLGSPLLGWISEVLEVVDGRLRLIQAGEEAVPGVRGISSPGHTPGHMCLGLEGDGQDSS